MEMTVLAPDNVGVGSFKIRDAPRSRRIEPQIPFELKTLKWWFYQSKANALSSLQSIEANSNWFSSQRRASSLISLTTIISLYGWGQIAAASSAFTPVNSCIWWMEREPPDTGMWPGPGEDADILKSFLPLAHKAFIRTAQRPCFTAGAAQCVY